LADKKPVEVTTEDLREVVDLWADRTARTRQKVTSILHAFWNWAEDQNYVPFDPAAKIRRPRAAKHTPSLLPANIDAQLLNAARTRRDRVAILILLDCGVRRAELAGVRVRDLDLARRQLTVFGKGQKSRVIPLRGPIVNEADLFMLEELEGVGRKPEPDDFLLYPEKRNPEQVIYWADPKKPYKPNGVHRWWYRQLEAAGLVGKGVRKGMNMHRARHTFATDVRRAHGDIGGVQHLLGHSDPSTTIALYGHYDQSDLERAMEAFAKSKDASVPLDDEDTSHG
jgi:integrase